MAEFRVRFDAMWSKEDGGSFEMFNYKNNNDDEEEEEQEEEIDVNYIMRNQE